MKTTILAAALAVFATTGTTWAAVDHRINATTIAGGDFRNVPLVSCNGCPRKLNRRGKSLRIRGRSRFQNR